MLKRSTALEALVIGVLGLGAVAATRALVGTTKRRINEVNEKHDPHEYAVMYSAHGLDFHFLGGAQAQPPHKTREDAVATARRFIATSKTIDGKAKVVNVRTGEELPF